MGLHKGSLNPNPTRSHSRANTSKLGLERVNMRCAAPGECTPSAGTSLTGLAMAGRGARRRDEFPLLRSNAQTSLLEARNVRKRLSGGHAIAVEHWKGEHADLTVAVMPHNILLNIKRLAYFLGAKARTARPGRAGSYGGKLRSNTHAS